ncbi:peptidoglycan-binding protein LysM [Shewanella sp. OPT22]|nr:peptidoglycan-binding protein LysM [Shewanella sp. OPT22]
MDSFMKRLTFLIFFLLSFSVLADELVLKKNHPDSYAVKKGDTLWDISEHFLNDPWKWPELWGANPQVANPHLIYPGDVLTLIFVNGQPRLVKQEHKKKAVVHMSPHGRKIPKRSAIPIIELSLIQSYLSQNRVEKMEWIEQQPQVLGGERESRYHARGDVIYIDSQLPVGEKLGIYEEGREFVSSVSDEHLGRELILAASGRVIESGSVSKVRLLSNVRETEAGFKALPVDEEALMSAFYMPSAGNPSQTTKVIAVGNTQREAGHLNVVYVDGGRHQGVMPGQVFDIMREGDQIVIDSDDKPVQQRDRNIYDDFIATVSEESAIRVPQTHRGNLIIFKSFEDVSLGLIMLNDRPVRVDDMLASPKSLKLLIE